MMYKNGIKIDFDIDLNELSRVYLAALTFPFDTITPSRTRFYNVPLRQTFYKRVGTYEYIYVFSIGRWRVPVANFVAARHRLDGQTRMRWIGVRRKLGSDGGALRVRAVGRPVVGGGRKT